MENHCFVRPRFIRGSQTPTLKLVPIKARIGCISGKLSRVISLTSPVSPYGLVVDIIGSFLRVYENCAKILLHAPVSSIVWVFGSILTPRFSDKSDVDMCVDFDWDNIPMLESANNFFGFQYALEDLLGRKVDLTDDSAVKNKYFREELNEKRQIIYG